LRHCFARTHRALARRAWSFCVAARFLRRRDLHDCTVLWPQAPAKIAANTAAMGDSAAPKKARLLDARCGWGRGGLGGAMGYG
jgi:hypothetical protein